MNLAYRAPFTPPPWKSCWMEFMDQYWRVFRNLDFGDIANSLGSGSQAPIQKWILELHLEYIHQNAIFKNLLSETGLSSC